MARSSNQQQKKKLESWQKEEVRDTEQMDSRSKPMTCQGLLASTE
jgi:hypothetical protein